MKKGAWGYVWRAILHGLLTAVRPGLMLPRQTFYLEKFKTDRSAFGSAWFEQSGTWTALYPAFKHVLIGIGLLVLSWVMVGVGFVNGGMGTGALGGLLSTIGDRTDPCFIGVARPARDL